MKYLPASLFIKNRYKLKELLLPASVVVISSNRKMPRNGDQYYPFRQSSNLYYLTGIKQELCTLVIYPDGGPDKYSEILFIPEGDKNRDKWDGERLSKKGANDISGIQDVRFTGEIGKDLKQIFSTCSYIYFGMEMNHSDAELPVNELEIRNMLVKDISNLQEHSITPLLTRLRMFKEPEELEMMKEAIRITGDAFIRVLGNLRPEMKEYEVAAHIAFEFQSQGTSEQAFDPIMASGKNALILHYDKNKGICRDGDLLLMDFGAEWEYYAADISRTIPVNGRFTTRQRALYDANLRVMNKAIKLMNPGIMISELNKEVGSYWEKEHVKLGLYSLHEIKKQSSMYSMWQRYYWHGTSHSIGIDVHDLYDHESVLKAGMVLSCEPGIYITEEDTGLRLENDILITNDGPVNLSENIPIDPDAIELIMSKS